MKLTEDLQKQIAAKLQERIGTEYALCPLCRKAYMIQMADYFFMSPLQSDSATLNLQSPRALFCVVLTCHNCGNTTLINLVTLGIAPKGPRPTEAASQPDE